MRHAILLAAALTFASPALACSCASYTPAQAVADNATIFIGVPTETVRTAHNEFDSMQTVFAIQEMLQGEVAATLNISHPEDLGGNCGVDFAPGQAVLVVALGNTSGKLATNTCTMLAANEAEIRAALKSRRKTAP